MTTETSILVIDDETELRELLRDLLEDVASRFLFASNGLEALEIMKTESVSAICCDLNMPEMGGLEFVRRIRQMGYATPVLILTGYSSSEFQEEAKTLGAMAFVSKPARREVLRDLMGRALRMGAELEALDASLREEFEKLDLPAEEIAKLYAPRRDEFLAKMENLLLDKKDDR